MDNNTEITKPKKLSKANLPFIIAIGLVLSLMILTSLNLPDFLISLFLIIGFAPIIAFPFLCIIGLVLQIKNKDKTIIDKVMIGCNSIVISIFVLFIVISFALFGGVVNEKDIRKQISQEYSTLDKEYTPVLDYLAKYKKTNGVYPETIDNKIILKSEVFEMYKYSRNNNGTGYWLEVYPKNGPVEYYYNDENDNGYNFYKGNGFIDGYLDNDYYYEINDKWHAIALENFSRHSKKGNIGNLERKTVEWMKDNIDKFEDKGRKNKESMD